MVEMRWLQIGYPPPASINPAAVPDSSGKFCRVLQYRQYSLDTSRSPVASWSEWIDVPTVTEG